MPKWLNIPLIRFFSWTGCWYAQRGAFSSVQMCEVFLTFGQEFNPIPGTSIFKFKSADDGDYRVMSPSETGTCTKEESKEVWSGTRGSTRAISLSNALSVSPQFRIGSEATWPNSHKRGSVPLLGLRKRLQVQRCPENPQAVFSQQRQGEALLLRALWKSLCA